MREYHLYDAKDKILGRFCSQIAKKALLGELIVIINAKDAIISGNKSQIHKKGLMRIQVNCHTNPDHGPFWKRKPDTVLREIVKKMLPRKQDRGMEAFRRVHVYVSGIPERFKARYPKLITGEIPNAGKERLSFYNKYITLDNYCVRIGWNKRTIEA